MAAHITGPVGLRHRATNVANKAADQRVLIDLLREDFSEMQGKARGLDNTDRSRWRR
jgi:hypothetical protein